MPTRPPVAGAWMWRYVGQRLRRAIEAGELRILALAIVVAVTAATAVGLFSERMRGALAAQSGDILGADLVVTGRDALPPTLTATAEQQGLRWTQHIAFPSLAIAGERSTLVSVKAVQTGYPLRGELRISDELFGDPRTVRVVPPQGEAWVDAKAWAELGLQRGGLLAVGALQLKVTALLAQEPDRGGGFFDLAPRVMINAADVGASQLVGEGSRVQHSLMLTGSPSALAQLRSLPLPTGLRWISPEEARPEVRNALRRAGQFLDVAVLAAALLAAAAIGLTAQQHGQRLRDEVAVLKCLGARQQPVRWALTLSFLGLGLIASVLGLLLGYAGQAVLAEVLSGLVENLQLPAPSLAALWPPLGLALVMLLGFALPPVLEASRVPPLHVFQRRAGVTMRSGFVWTLALIAVTTLLMLQTGELALASKVLAGAGMAALTLGLLAWLLVLALQPLRRLLGARGRSGFGWKLGLGNIARRRGNAVAQVVALGLGLLALLLVTVVREDLLQQWRQRLPAGTPNTFLINIQGDQRATLMAFFADHGYRDLQLWPMARARLVALNGQPVTADSFADEETRRWINRDFNLSWADQIGDDNRFIEGKWWGEAGQGQPWLSVEDYAVKRLGLRLGDRLTLQFAGRPIELTVHNTREVEWDSFKPNFFLLTPPGVIEEVPAQWITSFYLPPDERHLMRELVRAFPNITALDMEAAMNQVRSIVDRIVQAVEFMLLFTLAAGAVVLLAAIEGTRAERLREAALLRTLGAGRKLLAQGLLSEFATLGLLAGLVAALAAQALAWVLATQVLDITGYGLRPLLWLVGGIAGAALVSLLGWISVRGVLSVPPRQVLQAG